ncbi:MAG: T9SS type A sorting domain-containing protein [Bacteroidota bacterium]|nr:T9SS type A sorting domain-containing protein [Bacteroidota bacterium]
MKKIIFTSLLLIIFNTLFAQWQQGVGTDGGEMRGIVAIGNRLVASGVDGWAYYSDDEGQSWKQSGIAEHGLAYLATAGKYVYGNHHSGYHYMSADTGRTWSDLPGFPMAKKPFYPIGDSTIALLAPTGAICFSDSGATWHATDIGLSYVECLFESDSGIYAGCINGLYVSFDGMQNWSFVDSSFIGSTVWSVVADDSIVMAATTLGLRMSADYGETWAIVDSAWTNSVLKWNEKYLYHTSNNKIMISDDEGLSWQTSYGETPVTARPMIAFLSNVAFIGTKTGIRRSDDEGNTWTNADSLMNRLTFGSAVHCGNYYFATSQWGDVFRSADDGQHWNKLLIPTPNNTIGFLQADGDTLYGHRGDGVFISRDFGNTWTSFLFPGEYFRSVVKKGAKICAVSNPFKTYTSLDNGITWTTVSDPGFDAFYTIIEKDGFLFAGQGAYDGQGVYRSSDFGITWIEMEPTLEVIRLKVIEGKIFACGYSGRLSVSADNGITWNELHPYGIYNCTDVFAAGSEIWLCNSEGLNYTSDYGVNWINISPPEFQMAYAIAFTDSLIIAATNRGMWSRPRNIFLGLGELTENFIEAFPNPSTGIFNLQFEKPMEGKLCVYDVLGNCILTQQFSNSSTLQFSIAEQARGIYFIEVQAGEKKYNQKIILN